MKIRIIKKVWVFEDDFEIGKIYEATKTEFGDYIVCGRLVFDYECEEVI